MTTTPARKKSAATTSSALFWRGLLLARNEACGLHERDMARLFARHPLGVFLAFERSRVEGALRHQLLPVRRLLDLLQHVDVVGDLVLPHAAGHENAAQHQVLDIQPLALAG